MNEKDKKTPSARMKELTAAKKLILTATREEKQELFSDTFGSIEEYKAILEQPENRMAPHSSVVFKAENRLYSSLKRLTGYKLGWISDEMLAHNKLSGRSTKYTYDQRVANCHFIEQMVVRGSSARQAMMLLARLQGDISMSEGLQRELRETYKEYIQLKEDTPENDLYFGEDYYVAEFLAFSIEHLNGPEKASAKAVDAFRSFWQEVIDAIKDTYPIAAQHDGSYPEIFGNLILWVSQDYDDPLDYFYTHPSHKTDPLRDRIRWLRTYLNSLEYYRDFQSESQS